MSRSPHPDMLHPVLVFPAGTVGSSQDGDVVRAFGGEEHKGEDGPGGQSEVEGDGAGDDEDEVVDDELEEVSAARAGIH